MYLILARNKLVLLLFVDFSFRSILFQPCFCLSFFAVGFPLSCCGLCYTCSSLFPRVLIPDYPYVYTEEYARIRRCSIRMNVVSVALKTQMMNQRITLHSAKVNP